jgi:hypothetical protein
MLVGSHCDRASGRRKGSLDRWLGVRCLDARLRKLSTAVTGPRGMRACR